MEFPTTEAPKKIKPVKTESQLAEARESEKTRRMSVLTYYIEDIFHRAETEEANRLRALQDQGKITKAEIEAMISVETAEEADLKKYFKSKSVREKTEALYDKLIAYDADKMVKHKKRTEEMSQSLRESRKKKKQNPELHVGYDKAALSPVESRLVKEIEVLYNDDAVREMFLTSYAEAGTDAKRVRGSELNIKWNKIRDEIDRKEADYKKLAQDMHLGKIVGAGKISSAKTRLAILAESLIDLDEQRRQIETLQNVPRVETNTDVVANLGYEKLLEYKKQLAKGFVWLPSRKAIHSKTISAILNHRWPYLIGEGGSGKSEQANAAAIELTGYIPTEVECESNTGDVHLIMDVATDKNGAKYDEYKPLMQAFTGFADSRQAKPDYETGRLCRFDEAARLGAKAYSIIKKARQAKPGGLFYNQKVLQGAGAIWTSNPVGIRYPDRYAPDPAMRRELAEIPVPYVDMSPDSPELYEFALTTLLTDKNSLDAAKQELAPAYEKKDFSADQQAVLADGSVVKAKDEIIPDMADAKHGALWRFCGAIHALQESFVAGNAQTEKYPDTLLRFKEDNQNEMYVTNDGTGRPLTLNSTVSLGELRSWMAGFNSRREKRDKDFHGNTLTEWLDFKIKTYIGAMDAEDRERLVALFKHFHFLEGAVPNVANAKPLTAKEIGYLSPRVPRPLYVEKPPEKPAEPPPPAELPPPPNIPYVSRDVVMDDDNGSRMTITAESFELD